MMHSQLRATTSVALPSRCGSTDADTAAAAAGSMDSISHMQRPGSAHTTPQPHPECEAAQ
jgi:hypothetical protein